MRRAVCWLILCSCIGSALADANGGLRYRILVTNDDGIDSPGIVALADALRPLGDVLVVAPRHEQSGKSHATSIFETGVPSVAPVVHDGRVFGYAVDGTPADCVLVALHWLTTDRPFDIVVAGINYGVNLGSSSLYSGTVGATVEGALAGLPAVAVSQDHRRKDFQRSAGIAAEVVAQVLGRRLAPYTILNVNIPGGDLLGVKIAPMGSSNLAMDGIVATGSAADGTTGLRLKLRRATQVMEDTDTAYYLQGYVTITPLQVDWTAHQEIRTLRGWALQLPAGATTRAAGQ